jgi:hypothetical protein
MTESHILTKERLTGKAMKPGFHFIDATGLFVGLAFKKQDIEGIFHLIDSKTHIQVREHIH